MSSLKQLDSGDWRASVLLDNGHEVGRTFSTFGSAVAWTVSVKEERNAERPAKQSADVRRSIETALATLRRHASHGRISAVDRSALEHIHHIARTHPEAENHLVFGAD